MKNSYSKNQSFSRRIFGMFLMISASLLIAGCEKSDVLPSAATTNSSNKIIPSHVVPQIMVRIDHVAVTGENTDYKVEVYNTGVVIFEGRSRVAYLGTRYLHIDAFTVEFIKNMFLAGQFFSIPTNNKVAPYYVETTFSDFNKIATVRDLNDGSPQIILQLRKKTEELAGVKELVVRGPVLRELVASH